MPQSGESVHRDERNFRHKHARNSSRIRYWGPARLPPSFFAVAVLSFVSGVSTLPLAVPKIAEFFYQAIPLAVVHLFTLGWITAAVMGVKYRYVPALTQTPLRSVRLAWLQLVLFVFGASGMAIHFAIGIWPGLWLASIVMFLRCRRICSGRS
jgi:hypothetical protein